MPRAAEPATPADEIAAARARPAAEGPLSAELAAFAQSGLSVVIAACGLDGRPVAGRALTCRVEDGGALRVLLSRAANAALLAAADAGRPIAATVSRPHDHRSIQFKGAAARLAPLRPDDAAEAARQCDGMRRALQAVGYAPAFAAAYVRFDPADLAAVVFTPDSAFVQTPGPGAGGALAP